MGERERERRVEHGAGERLQLGGEDVARVVYASRPPGSYTLWGRAASGGAVTPASGMCQRRSTFKHGRETTMLRATATAAAPPARAIARQPSAAGPLLPALSPRSPRTQRGREAQAPV